MRNSTDIYLTTLVKMDLRESIKNYVKYQNKIFLVDIPQAIIALNRLHAMGGLK